MGPSGIGMTQEATQAIDAPVDDGPAVEAGGAARVGAGPVSISHHLARVRASDAVRVAWRAFSWSRLAILAVAVFAALSTTSSGIAGHNAERFGDPALTAPLDPAADLVFSPLARWDAVWYLSIANGGYEGAGSPRHAFFPLYPLLSRGFGEVLGGGRGAMLLAAYAVALAAFLAALILLYKLAELEVGRRAAAPTLLLLCLFPASLYFGAPYSESLFLLCSVAAFYAARTDRWAWAGAAAAGASATRSAGILLVLPLVALWLSTPRRSPRDLAWIALAPLGLAAYAGYLGIAHGDPLSFSHVQEFWNRSFAGPLVGAWDGLLAALDGVRQLLSGERSPVYYEQAAGDPFRVAAWNLALLGFLGFAVVGAIGVLRRLPFAYGLYVVAALALPLSYPVAAQPLMSLPRFIAVLFPIFIWFGSVCEERGLTERVAVVSAVGLGLFTTQFATWYWVA